MESWHNLTIIFMLQICRSCWYPNLWVQDSKSLERDWLQLILHCDKRGGVEEVSSFRFVLGENFEKGIWYGQALYRFYSTYDVRQTWTTCTHWSVSVVYCILGSPPRCRMPIKELLGTPQTMNVFFPSLHPLYLSFSWATITTCVCHLPSHHSFPSYTLQINILVCAMKGWSCQGWLFDTLQWHS
jgi:hypothetical protein